MVGKIDPVTKASIDKWMALRRQGTPIQASQRIIELEQGIIEARKRLAKGRTTWNGPCHECDAVLGALLGEER